MFIQFGFTSSRADPSLFIFKRGSNTLFLLVYVDDIILTVNDQAVIATFIASLHQEFVIKDLGKLSYFSGMEVVHTTNGLFHNRSKYDLDILSRAGLLDGKLVYIALSTSEALSSHGCPC